MSASYCVSGSVFTLIEKKLHNSHKIAKDICNNFPEWGNWGLFVCFCCCCCFVAIVVVVDVLMMPKSIYKWPLNLHLFVLTTLSGPTGQSRADTSSACAPLFPLILSTVTPLHSLYIPSPAPLSHPLYSISFITLLRWSFDLFLCDLAKIHTGKRNIKCVASVCVCACVSADI